MESALASPVGCERLEARVRGARRVLVVLSDTTSSEPRDALLRGVLARLPDAVSVEVAVATGTHGPCDIEQLGIGDDLAARIDRWVVHDGGRAEDLVAIGTTRRGTPVTLNRAVLDADLVVATGCIIPHYFAGYGAGIKSIFPGLGGSREVRINHELKAAPGARAGVVDGNPCREDLEEVAALLPAPPFLLNLVLDDDGAARAAVAGDVNAAFRAGATLCEPLYKVRSRRARCVVVSGRGPITSSLYQASKLVAAAAPLVAEGGRVVVVAECWRWGPARSRS
jgi:lactate racemase